MNHLIECQNQQQARPPGKRPDTAAFTAWKTTRAPRRRRAGPPETRRNRTTASRFARATRNSTIADRALGRVGGGLGRAMDPSARRATNPPDFLVKLLTMARAGAASALRRGGGVRFAGSRRAPRRLGNRRALQKRRAGQRRRGPHARPARGGRGRRARAPRRGPRAARDADPLRRPRGNTPARPPVIRAPPGPGGGPGPHQLQRGQAVHPRPPGARAQDERLLPARAPRPFERRANDSKPPKKTGTRTSARSSGS